MNGTAIASPPDLVGTGGTPSSVSSSTEPSSFHLDAGIVVDANDFEEIGLADDHDDNHRDLRLSQKHWSGKMQTHKNGPTAVRDLTHANPKKPYPLQTSFPQQAHSVDHLHVGAPPPAKISRSRLSTQSTPALPTLGARSRSPGPTPAAPPSPALSGVIAAPPLHPTNHGVRRASPGAPKRTSWQSSRKTSDQIEEEYDSDDEVPMDAIFYNVPLSPRSARALSAAPSPERERGANGLPSPDNARGRPKTAAIPVDGTAAEMRGRPEFRSKSWSDAMLELGDEAKELSEKLEQYVEDEMEQVARGLQKRAEPPQRKKSPPTTSIVQLPPVQSSNAMIDPLPISKEKEAVLSRTRPSWLPPKPKDEERRHLKEYQRMMRRSQEAERKRAEKARQELEEKDRSKNDINRIWEQRIIPHWSRAIRTQEARELWWQGVAPKSRGVVWQLSFGNQLTISAESYRLALKRAREAEDGVKKSPEMYPPKERELFMSIKRDVDSTFPELKIFQEGGPLHQSLMNVLMAYAMYRSDVGYVYGTHTVAGLLLLNLSAEQSFVTLANILNRPLPLAFFTQDEGGMSRAYSLFLKAFQYKLPSLYRHIHQTLQIAPAEYLEPMFLTLFAFHCSVDHTSRIWDVYSFEGDAFLVRTAVGILVTLETKLYGTREEVMKILGWGAKPLDLGTEDAFMANVRAAGKEDTPGTAPSAAADHH